MVRCLGVILVLALLLCGCVQNTAKPTAPTDLSQSGASASTGLYVSGSDIEKATDGAVRGFRLEDGSYYGCAMLGDELIVMGMTEEGGTLALYHGENLEEVRTVSLGRGVSLTNAQMQINDQGIGYYDSVNRAIVFLSVDFVETGRMYLPAEMQGGAWLSPDWKTVYYCTEKGVHIMDLQTGISRLLRAQSAISQEITGGFGAGQVLRCEAEITEGQKQIQLIDSETGVVLREGAQFDALVTQGDRYYLPYEDRGVLKLRFGNAEDHQILWPAEEGAEPKMLFDNNAILMVRRDEQETDLAYYDLQTGKRTAAITLEGVTAVWGVQGDGENGVWMLARDDADEQWLYHWDCGKSLTGDETDYTAPRYTMETSDTEGLARIAEKADEIGSKFGIDILVWQDAAATAPADQYFTCEYVTQLYEHYLPKLEEALSVFPEGFFGKTSGGKLQIALLRTITGDPSKGTLAQTDCVQFWKGNVPVVAVTMGEDFEQNLYHGVYLYMETRILSKSSALYEWYRINPAAFDYDNSYITNLDRKDTTYIEGEKPYFIDLFSMSYPKEDRATIFEYACMPGNEEYFETKVLQEKLKRICKGIREAYGLKTVETEFLWEQYLV